MAVRVVVDSTAGLPQTIADELDITVLNLHVMHSAEAEQSTSGLSPLELTAAYARQLERGGDDGVVALHLAKGLSSTWSAAVTASGVFGNSVRVVDTDSAGMAVGAAAMAAATLARQGADLDECEAMARSTIERSATWLYLHQVEGLRKSGRLSTGAALSATLLATKPILRLRAGKFEIAAKTRTQTKAFARLAELVMEGAHDQPVFAAIQHTDAYDSAEQVASILGEVLPSGSQILVEPFDKVLAAHTGKGAVGLSVVFTPDPRFS